MRSKKGVEIRQGLELSLRTLCLILRDRICCTFCLGEVLQEAGERNHM